MVEYDLVLKDCNVYDGSGQPAYPGDIGIKDGRIAAIAPLLNGSRSREIRCDGLAAAPGFINLHSWAATDLLSDGRAMSDVLQGVTLEVFGESWSEGPLSPEMKAYIQGIYGLPHIPWTSLSDFLTLLEQGTGVSLNVASFVGVDNLRYHTVGQDSRAATPAELAQMAALLEQEMRAGAMGVGSALIYVPGLYFQTHELRALARVAFQSGGAYISHIRSEGNRFEEALDEFLEISAGGRGLLYHFKLQGEKNWAKLPGGLARIAQAQSAGTQIGACVYPYTGGMTSLSSVLPPWARAGGQEAMLATLANPHHRERLVAEMAAEQDEWENLYVLAGGAEQVHIMDLKSSSLGAYNGLKLAQIAARMGLRPEETLIELMLVEQGDPSAIFFHASEDNLRAILRQPWVCLGSDIGAMTDAGNRVTHPRAFGSFARFLGRYVRDLGLMSLEEGVRRLTALPAELLGIQRARGYLRPEYAADITLFEPAAVRDCATYEAPLRYAQGVRHVLVNGQVVVEDGAHTGAKPGRFVRGPGYRP